MSPPAEKGKGKEVEPDPPIFRPFSPRRVNPRAASGGGAWEDAPPPGKSTSLLSMSSKR